MKTLIALGITILASMAGVLVPSSNALAATVHSGAICHNYNKGQANDFDFYSDGIRNGATGWRSVICPLVVNHTSGQLTGSVYVQVNTPTNFSCTLYSYSWSDSFKGAKSGWTSTPSKLLFLGTVPADTFSSHSVICSLPANYVGKIVGIETYF